MSSWRFQEQRLQQPMSKTFLNTKEAEAIFVLDYYGYPLAHKQGDLTIPQELFLLLGKPKFDKKINKEQEKQYK